MESREHYWLLRRMREALVPLTSVIHASTTLDVARDHLFVYTEETKGSSLELNVYQEENQIFSLSVVNAPIGMGALLGTSVSLESNRKAITVRLSSPLDDPFGELRVSSAEILDDGESSYFSRHQSDIADFGEDLSEDARKELFAYARIFGLLCQWVSVVLLTLGEQSKALEGITKIAKALKDATEPEQLL